MATILNNITQLESYHVLSNNEINSKAYLIDYMINKLFSKINLFSDNVPMALKENNYCIPYYGIQYIISLLYNDYQTILFSNKNTIIQDMKTIHAYYRSKNKLTIYAEVIYLHRSEYMMFDTINDARIDNSYYITSEYARQVFANNGHPCAFKVVPVNIDNVLSDRIGIIVYCTRNLWNGSYNYPNPSMMEYRKDVLHSILTICKTCKSINQIPKDKILFSGDMYIRYKNYERQKPIYNRILPDMENEGKLKPAMSYIDH